VVATTSNKKNQKGSNRFEGEPSTKGLGGGTTQRPLGGGRGGRWGGQGGSFSFRKKEPINWETSGKVKKKKEFFLY